MGKVLLFGAGLRLQSFLRYCSFNVQMQDVEIVAVCDNDCSKHGQIVAGYTVQKPDVLDKLEYEDIVIVTQYWEDVKKQLSEEYGINSNVFTDYEYKKKKTIGYNVEISQRRNAGEKLQGKDRFDLSSLVVYTSIINDYDELKDPKYISDDVKYVCYTNNKRLTSDVWDVRYIESKGDPRQAVREYKLLPHRFFPEFQTSIWIDANITICENLTELLKLYQKSAPLLFFPHFERVCIYEEAAACINADIEDKGIILKQVNRYYNEGYPLNQGLIWGGFLVRQHSNPDVQNLMEEWWNEILNFSKRDQISIPYLIYKNNMHYDLCSLDFQNNRWIKYRQHKNIHVKNR